MKKPKRLVQFEVHWIDGKVDIIEGKSVMDAFERAGIANYGCLNLIDYYKKVEDPKNGY